MSRGKNLQFLEFEQTDSYIAYMRYLGWKSGIVNNSRFIYKDIKGLGRVVKLQHPSELPDAQNTGLRLRKIQTDIFSLEPSWRVSQIDTDIYVRQLRRYGIRLFLTPPYLRTKTRHIDLCRKEDLLFRQLHKSKRHRVRRAVKYGVRVCEISNFAVFSQLKNISSGFAVYFRLGKLRYIWDLLSTNEKIIALCAYSTVGDFLGAELNVIYEKTAYSFIGGTNLLGQKLFASQLLRWESIRRSNVAGATIFDVGGVWDERFPKKNLFLQGITKFKEGFGGYPIYYPLSTKMLLDETTFGKLYYGIRVIND